MPYAMQYALAVFLTIMSTGIGLVLVTEPSQLGLLPMWVKWLAIINAMIGVSLGFLPKVTKPPSDDRRGQD